MSGWNGTRCSPLRSKHMYSSSTVPNEVFINHSFIRSTSLPPPRLLIDYWWYRGEANSSSRGTKKKDPFQEKLSGGLKIGVVFWVQINHEGDERLRMDEGAMRDGLKLFFSSRETFRSLWSLTLTPAQLITDQGERRGASNVEVTACVTACLSARNNI